MKQFCIVSFFVFAAFFQHINAQPLTPFKENDRVVFLGNSITDGGRYHSYIWLYYMIRYPDMRLTIFNAGIGGDAAQNMFNRLDGDVFSKRPTVIATMFGMNDTGYFEYNQSGAEEYADKRVSECFEWFTKIEERYKKLPNTRIILMGSSPYDETMVLESPNNSALENNKPFKNKNKAILRVDDFKRQSAINNGWEFLDLNRQMTAINEREQKANSAFTLCGKDRIHPENDGHMVMAYLFLKAQGVGKKVAEMDIDASKATVKVSSECTISNLKKTSTGISFDYLAKTLPYPLDTLPRGWGAKMSQAKAVKVIPFMEEMNMEMLKVSGLKGSYRLMIDNEEIGTWNADEWAKGINLASLSHTPQYQQALAILHMNEERLEIERRFRDYAYVQFNFFRDKGLLFADNREALRVLDEHTPNDGWLRSRRDLYARAMFPEIREAWQNEMNILVDQIYEMNQPKIRKITLIQAK